MRRTLIGFATLLLLQTVVFARTATRVRVGKNPDFVAVNLTTNLIYSSNSGDGTVSVIDGATNTVTATIAVGGFPQGIAANPATNKIYVALFAGSSSTVSVIDGSTNTVVASIPDSGAIYVIADGVTNRIYTSNSDNTVRVIDGSSDTVAASVPFSNVLEQLAVDVTRNLIYVSQVGSPPSVAVIDGTTNAVVNTFTVAQALFLPGLAVDSSLNQIYAVDSQKQSVYVIDGATGNVTKTISLPGAVNAKYAALATHHQVLVSDPSSSGKVFFINGSTQSLIGTVSLKFSPWGLAVNFATRDIYVALSSGSWVTAIAP